MTPEKTAFIRLLAWRPQRAMAVAYWHVTGRRVRARNCLRNAVAESPFAYVIMTRENVKKAAASAAAPGGILCWPARPSFSILAIAPAHGSARWAGDAIRAALGQSYDRWELLLAGLDRVPLAHSSDARIRILPLPLQERSSALALAVATAHGDYVVPLELGTGLSPVALFRFAEALREAPDAHVLYGDEDTVDAKGRRTDPWLKPSWNSELILALDFASRACALEITAARNATASLTDMAGVTTYALLLAMTRSPFACVVHVPHVLAHVKAGSRDRDQGARVVAVAARVEDEGGVAKAGPFGTVTVQWPMPEPPPSVTILVPTRDRVDLVRACVDSLLAKTHYLNYAVVVIDNDSVMADTKAYFNVVSRDARVSVLACDLPYNFSAINNFAVAETTSDYLCFLNNDTEIIDGAWLGEMMRYAARPEVGAVGAQLLYKDGSIQHAGVVIGLGNAAGHAHRGLPQGEAGYFAQAHAAHYASAVTAACLVVERDKFLSVGGFDEKELQIAYNDVDLCLKLGRAGWRNVYAPQARLLHLESRSRGFDLSPTNTERYMRELAVLQERWATTTVADPMHHPLLDRNSETYRMAFSAPDGDSFGARLPQIPRLHQGFKRRIASLWRRLAR